MTSHHAKFQLDSSKRSQVIPLQKSTQRQRRRQRRQRRRQRHPPGLNYSPRRKVFRRGQKKIMITIDEIREMMASKPRV